MTIWLKQSTAADVVIGPFVDDTDGKTVETALTVSQADCQLSKNGGAVAQKNDATSASHLGGGHYKVPLNTTDTNTLGRLRLYVNEGGALPVWADFMVAPAAVYDSLFSSTAWGGAADAIWDEATSGHTTAGTTGKALTDANNGTPPTAAAIADAVWDEDIDGHMTADTFGAYMGEAASDPWNTIMTDYTDADTAGKILNDIAGSSGATPADIADAVWDEATADHVAAGSAGLAMAYARDGSSVYGSTTAALNLKKAFDGSGSYTASTLTIGAVTDVTNVVDANLTGINSDAATWAAALAIWKSGIPGMVASGSNTSTVITTDLPSTATGRYIGKTLAVLTGSRAGEGGKLVTAYNGTTKELTVETMTGALTVGDTFVLLG
jgi:hypothetical protein